MRRKPDYDQCPVSYVKCLLRKASVARWSTRYNEGTTASITKLFFPDATEAYYLIRKIQPTGHLTQIFTGHGGFSQYLNRFKCRDNPWCICDNATEETVPHLLTECPIHMNSRHEFEQEKGLKIDKVLQRNLLSKALPPLYTNVRWRSKRLQITFQWRVPTSCMALKRLIHSAAPLRGKEVVKAPTFPDSVSTGDVKFIKKEGDAVAMDEEVLQIETDKTALPVMAPGHGVILKMLVKEGEAVKSQQPLFEMDVTGVAPAAAAPKPAAAAAPAAPAAAAAPAAPAAVPARAPAPAAAPKEKPAESSAKAPEGATFAAKRITDPTKTISGSRTEFPVPLNKMRKRIAERLKEAQNTTAMLTTFNECDMSRLMAFRKANLEAFKKKYGVKLSFMSPFLKAAANALEDQPVINSVIVGDDIIYRDYVDISVAVATPKGLLVPVMRNVESMDYPRIELTINELAVRAREGKLSPKDMQGGTFTISNGGVFGSLLSMPIINLPQSAILGMHAIFQRPVAINNEVKIRPMMYIALTYDHRLIDGREAVLFLRKVKAGVEDPTSILAGV